MTTDSINGANQANRLGSKLGWDDFALVHLSIQTPNFVLDQASQHHPLNGASAMVTTQHLECMVLHRSLPHPADVSTIL